MEHSEITNKVKAYLEDSPYIYKNMGSWYAAEIYADYRDEISDSDAIKILGSENPIDAFYEWIDQAYLETKWYYQDELIKELAKELDIDDTDRDVLRDVVEELVCFEEPCDHYLDQEFKANITTDTGDGNFDYVLNSVYPHYAAESGHAIDDRASIVWLAKTQGYTKGQLRRALEQGDVKDPNGFLESMRQEVINLPSCMSTVTFLAKMTLGQLITLNQLIRLQDRNGHFYDARMNPYCGWISIDKRAETGLFDPWNGGGSVFEIQLEKDVKLPIRSISRLAMRCSTLSAYSLVR